MVRVEHDGARARRAVDVPDHGRATALAHDLDVEPLGAQQRGGRLGAGLDVRLVEGVEADARDAGERLEVGADGGHEAGDTVALEVGDLVSGQDVVGHGGEPSGWRDAPPGHGEAARPDGDAGEPGRSGIQWARVRTQQDDERAAAPTTGAAGRPARGREEPAHAQAARAGGGAQAAPRRRRPQGRPSATDQLKRQRGLGQDAPGDAHRRRRAPARPRQGPGAPLHPRLHRRPLEHRRVHAAGDARRARAVASSARPGP